MIKGYTAKKLLEDFNSGDGSNQYNAQRAIVEFFESLPPEIDLVSAAYYVKENFKRNSTGVDDRHEIYSYTDDDFEDGYDSWYDDDDDWEDDYRGF